MDFSMPSYSGDSSASPKAKGDSNAPSFNPFGDFEPKLVDDEAAAARAAEKAATKAQDEAAAAATKAEKEQAAAATKAEKEEAAAAAKAEKEEAAAAKKAEKDAKREAEMEKQRIFKEAQQAFAKEPSDKESQL